MLGIKYIHDNYQYKFLYCIGSDTFVNVQNLLELLNKYNYLNGLYIGGHGDIRYIQNKPIYFHSGGSGFILSNKSVYIIYSKLITIKNEWLLIDYQLKDACDVCIGYLMYNNQYIEIIKLDDLFFGCNILRPCRDKCKNHKINNIISTHYVLLNDFDSLFKDLIYNKT